jgi:ABC-type transporter Mla maintaining outer membrane lipid asymmetry permease subunit MlaE
MIRLLSILMLFVLFCMFAVLGGYIVAEYLTALDPFYN